MRALPDRDDAVLRAPLRGLGLGPGADDLPPAGGHGPHTGGLATCGACGLEFEDAPACRAHLQDCPRSA